MGERRLEELLIENTIDNNPSIFHKLMQVSTFSYIEKKREIDYADAEYPLQIYRKRMNYSVNENEKKKLKTDKWNADLVLLYNDNGKRICEIVEIETIKADELLHHRKKNILKKIRTVERAYNAVELNEILKVDEIRFSLSLNAAHLTENERYRVARRIGSKIVEERNADYKDEKVSLYKIYMLKDNVWDYCPESEEKEFLMSYNLAMRKNSWKNPLKKVMAQLYYNLKDDSKVKALYERHYFKR
ncbi:MAG: hypothetical protein QXD02_00525 [Candidatus Parvarchaeum sp.]|nr:hypothetical protein [Candidatus Parvarchaeota archaeon]MCW1295527.1 hypothetical protein [Candidatus Parvarchaeum tengchongense]MCW1298795.1 hypothetical protein [Candidatus Parvarchaeum tengchongense]